MTNFELIDDYLSNRLNPSEKTSFEQEITSNSSLRTEVELQKNILEGIKKTRAAELKAMLNNVPIGSPVSSTFTVMKMAAGIVGAGILITSLYYYYKSEKLPVVPNLSTSIQDSVQDIDSSESAETIIPIEKADSENENTTSIKSEDVNNKTSDPKKQEAKPSVMNQPKIDVVDPTSEMSSESSPVEIKNAEGSKSVVSTSPIHVETNSSNKKYNFHYQFKNDKLLLFGPFDKNLYEILEINGENHSVFLFHQENYYHLDEKQGEITKLSLIKDSELLKKLKEYRNK